MSADSGPPLSPATHTSWDRLIAEANPASLLVAIRGMMGERIRQHHEPEDVWQETLLMAWRDRAAFEWRGPGSFRRWLLQVARHRVHDLADHADAGIRGRVITFSALPVPAASDSGGAQYAGPIQTKSPGRSEADRELAARMESALAALADEQRDVVRLRLFEDLTMEEVGQRLGVGVEAVRYRFRQGLACYHRVLRQLQLVDSGGLFPR